MFRTALMVVAVTASAHAAAQPYAAGERFDRLMERGLAHREAGNDAAALVEFLRCVELRPASGQAIGQVGFAEMALGHLVLAEAHLSEALSDDDDPWVRRHRSALEEARDEIHSQIAIVEIPVDDGEVTFLESGQLVTRPTPVHLRLSPGTHELAVRSAGFETTVTQVTVIAGQRAVHLPLRTPSTAPVGQPMLPRDGMPRDGLLREGSARGPFEGPEGVSVTSDRYRIRSIRLHVMAGIFAGGAIGTGIGAAVTAPTTDPWGDTDPRSRASKGWIGATVSCAALAVILFITARVARAKHRREITTPPY